MRLLIGCVEGLRGVGCGWRGDGRRRARRGGGPAARVITLLVRHLQQPAVADVLEHTHGVIVRHRREVSKLTVHLLCSLTGEEHVGCGQGRVWPRVEV